MRTAYLLLVLFFITAFTCSKSASDEEQYTTFFYKQTQCADPWQRGNTDSVTMLNVTTFLNAQNLYVAGVQIKQDDTPAVCAACQCKTGKTIYVTSFDTNTNKTKFLALGFQQ